MRELRKRIIIFTRLNLPPDIALWKCETVSCVLFAVGTALDWELQFLRAGTHRLVVAFALDKDAILAKQQKRRDERGRFEKRIKLLWTE